MRSRERRVGWCVAALVGMAACDEPTVPAVDTRWEAVSVGGYHACAISVDGRLACWGANDRAQTGAGGEAWSLDPRILPGDGRVYTAVSAGGRHTCAIDGEGRLWCWGANDRGQVGDGGNADRDRPTPIQPDSRFAVVSAGFEHTCAVRVDGILLCWGANQFGQLGIGRPSDTGSPPTRVVGPARWGQVAAGGRHTCGLDASGAAHCWGDGRSGLLGTGALVSSPAPSRVGEQLSFVSIDVGGSHSCGIVHDGSVWCWGDNRFGQAGASTDARVGSPTGLIHAGAVALAVGEDITCTLMSDTSVRCRGRGGPDDDPGPTRGWWVPIRSEAGRLDVGMGGGCVVTLAADLTCWGAIAAAPG